MLILDTGGFEIRQNKVSSFNFLNFFNFFNSLIILNLTILNFELFRAGAYSSP